MPNLGTTEILLILAVVILLFGAKKLPELARGSGKALRIFKTEVKALHDDDDKDAPKPASLETTEATDRDIKREQG
ncbi:Sec-independent protein translocase subunit TatA [Aeromicrobium sp. P5_D10]